jgi:ParB-like chromosome segregation protein Spo0J
MPDQQAAFPELEPPREPTDTSSMVAQPELMPVEMGLQLKVAPRLVELLVPIDSVKPHPHNLRKHNMDAIVAAIDKYGIMSPIVVQASTRWICKGNGTWKAAKQLGATEIPASIVELDDDTAWQYLLDDNRASDLADYDRVELTKALTSLADAGQLDQTLWTLDDLETLQAEQGQIAVLEPAFMGDYALDDATLAERRARVTQATGSKMRQTSVILSVAQHEAFMANVAALRKEYGTTGVIATVVEAVKREAARLADDAPSAVEETEEELLTRID